MLRQNNVAGLTGMFPEAFRKSGSLGANAEGPGEVSGLLCAIEKNRVRNGLPFRSIERAFRMKGDQITP
jgi:hypothetical protein